MILIFDAASYYGNGVYMFRFTFFFLVFLVFSCPTLVFGFLEAVLIHEWRKLLLLFSQPVHVP